MLEGHSYAACLETHCVYGDSNHAETAEHTPRQNQLLAALPADGYERLLPDLKPISLPQGWTVHGAGERRDYLYFITAGIVSRFYVTENGASAELAITGSEGVLGVAWVLGGERSLGQSVVVSAGHAYRVRTSLLKNELERDGPLLQLLLRYTQALIQQTGQIAVCNRHHSLKQRLCRWILSYLDRVPSSELAVTHELIAQMLGVRREGVSEAAGKLQREGLIYCHRGQIVVLDRARLEAQACECYAAVKREYDRLLCPQNTRKLWQARYASPVPRRMEPNPMLTAQDDQRPRAHRGVSPYARISGARAGGA